MSFLGPTILPPKIPDVFLSGNGHTGLWEHAEDKRGKFPLDQKQLLKKNYAEYNAVRLPKDRSVVCHAPFVSMNFEQSGKVTACCYNRTHVIGNYPENSIDQMWRSSQMEELRSALENLDFSKGCEKCADHLLTKNYYSPLMKNFDKLPVNGREAAKLGPSILEFELSNACNLECIMCNGHFSSSIRRNREKLPALQFPWDQAFVEQLRPYWKNVEWAKFLGGEPFLNPLYFDIWDQIAEENPKVKVVITTNATVLNDKVKRMLERVKPMLVLSIDSMEKKTYESIRVNAKFDDTMAHLQYFLSYARLHERTIDVVVCPMQNNWQDLPAIFKWGVENIVQVSFNTVHYPLELALMNASQDTLLRAVDLYRNSKIPDINDLYKNPSEWAKIVSTNNRNRFTSLIEQIEHWAQAKQA